MYKLLRMKCLSCHRFRLEQTKSRIFRVKLLLCDCGDIVRAHGLDDEVLSVRSGDGDSKDSGDEATDRLLSEIESECLAQLGQHAAASSRSARVNTSAVAGAMVADESLDQELYVPLPASRSSHAREMRLDIIAAFLKAMPNTCAHCGAQSPNMRKDGVHKIFLKNPPSRVAQANAAKGVKFTSAASRLRSIHAAESAASAAENAALARTAAGLHSDEDDEGDADLTIAEARAKYGVAKPEEEEDLLGAVHVEEGAGGSVAGNSAAGASDSTAPAAAAAAIASEDEEDDEDDEVQAMLGSDAGQKKPRSRAGSTSSAGSGTSTKVTAPAERYLHPSEIEAQIQLLWRAENTLCRLIWAANTSPRVLRAPSGWKVFFIRTVLVTPNRFRPPTTLGDLTFEHPHNAHMTAILNHKARLQGRQVNLLSSGAGSGDLPDLATVYSTWAELQDAVCGLMDQSKAVGVETARNPGIRQLLERKEGLFRKNMMGKRVNFAARSVISPDPYIRPDQVGVPVVFAKTLTFPTLVTPWNAAALRQAVINGPSVHPGANFVEDEAGHMVDLSRRTKEQREVIARTLLTPSAGGPLTALPIGAGADAALGLTPASPRRKGGNTAGSGFGQAAAAAAAGSSGDASRKHLAAAAWEANADTDANDSAFENGAESAASASSGGALVASGSSSSALLAGGAGGGSLGMGWGWKGVGKRVWRHLQDGDVVLMNRQPTLHKPSIMAHVARVLRNATHRTIRMHYANCKTYNADFDGDEMNMHFPQTEQARAEAYTIASTSHQYVVPTTGKPIRGLIQDHVGMGVLLTSQDKFLNRDQYQQLVYAGALGLPDFCTVDIQGDALAASRNNAGASAGVLTLGVLGTGGAIRRTIPLDKPAILKPVPMWTGKQVISTLLKALTWDIPAPSNTLTIRSKTSVPAKAWCERARGTRAPKAADKAAGAWAADAFAKVGDHVIIVRQNEMCTGVLDKASLGNATYGIVHGAYELFGPERASALLSGIGRLLTVMLQEVGLTCCMDDLVLLQPADVTRRRLVAEAYQAGSAAGAKWAKQAAPAPMPAVHNAAPKQLVPGEQSVDTSVQRRSGPGLAAAAKRLGTAFIAGDAGLPDAAFVPGAERDAQWTLATRRAVGRRLLGTDAKAAAAAAGLSTLDAWKGVDLLTAQLDGAVKGAVATAHSAVLDSCLPSGLYKPFPENNFSLMVTTGAKGSRVNHAMITCGLGQQELEGRRVPSMVSGKGLPSFPAHHPHPRAGGFVADRFLTGLRPQEYYFHCMSGREGLVDTAVKTSRSGYLQRCLVKHLEDLRVAYDFTVRDSEGSVYQFLYGEDGMDVTQAAYLPPTGDEGQLTFLSDNAPALSHSFGLSGADAANAWWTKADDSTAVAAQERVTRSRAAWDMAQRASKPHKGDKKGLAVHVFTPGSAVQVRRLMGGGSSYSKALSAAPSRADGSRKTTGILGNTWVKGFVVRAHGPDGAPTAYDVQVPDPAASVAATDAASKNLAQVESDAGHDEASGEISQTVEDARAAAVGAVVYRSITPCIKGVWVLRPYVPGPVVGDLPMSGKYLGLLPEATQDAVDRFCGGLRQRAAAAAAGKGTAPPLGDAGFNSLMWLKALRSVAAPGEPVGILAAQSVGEPSTQMTLNTFHLAGSGGVNVTLGIPRLREIVMTASQNLKTPSMLLPVDKRAAVRHILALRAGKGAEAGAPPSKDEIDASATALATGVANKLRRLTLSDVVDYTTVPPLPEAQGSGSTAGATEGGGGMAVMERLCPRGGQGASKFSEWVREYSVTLQLVPQEHITAAYGLSFEAVAKKASQTFTSLLLAAVEKQIRRAASRGGDTSGGAVSTLGHVSRKELSAAQGNDEEDEDGAAARLESKAGAGGDSDDEGDAGEADGTSGRSVRGVVRGYGDDDAGAVEGNDAADVDGSSPVAGAASDEEAETPVAAPVHGGAMIPGVVQRLAVSAVAARSQAFSSFEACAPSTQAEGGWLRVTLQFPAAARKVLMLAACEVAVKSALLASTRGIMKGMPGKVRMLPPPAELEHGPLGRVGTVQGVDVSKWAPEYYSPKREQPVAATEGVNFPAVWAAGAGVVDMNRLYTNDIGAVLRHYGVEAARAAIVREVKSVFGVYGIKVDPRHLGLIADYMTYGGGFKAMNRLGMRAAPSPYQQMSFETTAQFLMQAALYSATGKENLTSPSASLVMGQPALVGVGGVQVMQNFQFNA